MCETSRHPRMPLAHGSMDFSSHKSGQSRKAKHRKKRKLKTGIGKRRWRSEKKNHRSDGDGVKKLAAPIKNQGEDYCERHECCVQNWRTLLHDGNVADYAENNGKRGHKRESLNFRARQKKKCCECSDVQACNNQNVKHTGL